MKVLFIDDDPDDFEVFCEALKSSHPEAVCEYQPDGEAALRFLREQSATPPEHIFLDVHMPRMGGEEFLKHIHADEKLRRIPVIVFSGSIHPSESQRLKELGASDVIIKPSTFREIVHVLAEKLKTNR